MSLADRLRRALDAPSPGPPALIPSDTLEEEEGPGPEPAAVLVAIIDQPRPALILTRRPETMRRHPGQVAFPGGRIDAGDDGPIAAALREAEEEIGLPRAAVEIIGLADSYRTVTGFTVTPVIGIIPPGLALVAHPGEVDEIFEAPLDHLFDPANHVERSGVWRSRERHWLEIDYLGWRIWGATAAMIVNLGRRLTPLGAE